MENFGYLLAAYSIIFTAIFLYVMFIWRRQARIDAEVSSVEARLQEVRDALAARSGPPSHSASS